jgi:hypothetical protein
MSDIAAKIFSDDNVPRRAMSSVELLLDLSGDVFLDVEFLEGRRRDVDRFLLHLLAHVNVFDDGFGATAYEARLAGHVFCLGGWCVYFVCHVFCLHVNVGVVEGGRSKESALYKYMSRGNHVIDLPSLSKS